MRVHWFQHVDFEGLGSIDSWLIQRGHSITVTRFWRGELPPPVENYDWLIVMGGPMNIYEHDAYPWLVVEKAAIRKAIAATKRVLGICLGAQLIADVLGGKVTRNAHTEIGWLPVTLRETTSSLIADWPTTFDAFHWHGDTFSLPPNATHLAASLACEQQAFAYGDRVLGLQFHLEIQAADLDAWLAQPDGLPPPSATIQTAEQMRANPGRFAVLNQLMAHTLSRLGAA